MHDEGLIINFIGHGPFSHMFEYGIYEQLKLEYRDEFQAAQLQLDQKWEVYSYNFNWHAMCL
jgi:hypothetical protein